MSATLVATIHALPTPGDLRALLMAACPPGPSLHPAAGGRGHAGWWHDDQCGDDCPGGSWNGWNQAHLVGIDADGVPFQADVSAYASGWHSMSLGRLGSIPHGAISDEDAEQRTGLRFPVQVFPPLPVVLHPEHTAEV